MLLIFITVINVFIFNSFIIANNIFKAGILTIMEQQNPNIVEEQKPDVVGEQKPDVVGEQKTDVVEEQKPDVVGEPKTDVVGEQNPHQGVVLQQVRKTKQTTMRDFFQGILVDGKSQWK